MFVSPNEKKVFITKKSGYSMNKNRVTQNIKYSIEDEKEEINGRDLWNGLRLNLL